MSFALLRENLLLRAFLAILLVLVLVDGGVTYLLRLPIESSVRQEAVRDILATTRPRILKMVGPQDMAQPMSGRRYEEVDQMVKDYALGTDLVRLKLWNPAGRVVYSTLPSQIRDFYPENRKLQEALQGRTVWEVAHETEALQERGLGDLMEVYVPLVWQPGAKPAGVLEVYLAYAPYARQLASIRNAIFLASGLAALTLTTAMYLLYRTGYRAMRRERDIALQRQREVQGLNRLLQQDLSHYLQLRDRLLNLRAQVMQDPRFQPDAAPVSARDAWLLMEIRELAEFAADIMAAEESKKQEGKPARDAH